MRWWQWLLAWVVLSFILGPLVGAWLRASREADEIMVRIEAELAKKAKREDVR